MAWRIDGIVQAGEIDNTQFGWTIGWIELEGKAERLHLKLAGNCHPDLAGWRFQIVRTEPDPKPEDPDDAPPDTTNLSTDQSGHVGDITADQMIKQFDMPTSAVITRLRNGEKPPYVWRKCLYLEWHSNHNGRVVIQSTRLEVRRLGERAFELTEDQWREQQRQNQQEMEFFLARACDALDNAIKDEDPND